MEPEDYVTYFVVQSPVFDYQAANFVQGVGNCGIINPILGLLTERPILIESRSRLEWDLTDRQKI